MSSLRLALKQSLVEAGVGPTKKEKSERKRVDILRRQRQHSYDPHRSNKKPRLGEPPRKRGRPRKHPLPDEQQQQQHQEVTGDVHDDNNNNNSNNNNSSNSSSSSDENEFSGSSTDQSGPNNDNDDDDDDDDDANSSTLPTINTSRGLFDSDDDSRIEWDQANQEDNYVNRNNNDNNNNNNNDNHHSAANKIQSQWKRTKHSNDTPDTRALSHKPPLSCSNSNNKSSNHSTANYNSTTDLADQPKRKTENKPQTVTPPSSHIVDWMDSMSQKKKRRHITSGLRVKVGFHTKVKRRDQKVVKKFKWFGGVVTAVSTGGSKIRIKYDDGTSEVTKFPDKDVIVDQENNGRHRVPADVFLPPGNDDPLGASKYDENPDNVKVQPEPCVLTLATQRDQSGKSPKTDTDDAQKSLEKPSLSLLNTSLLPHTYPLGSEQLITRQEMNESLVTSSPLAGEAISTTRNTLKVHNDSQPTVEISSGHHIPSHDSGDEKVEKTYCFEDRLSATLESSSEAQMRSFATTDESSEDDGAYMEVIEESTLSEEETKRKVVMMSTQTASRNKPGDCLSFLSNDGGDADNEDKYELPLCTLKQSHRIENNDNLVMKHNSIKMLNCKRSMGYTDQCKVVNQNEEGTELDDMRLKYESTIEYTANHKGNKNDDNEESDDNDNSGHDDNDDDDDDDNDNPVNSIQGLEPKSPKNESPVQVNPMVTRDEVDTVEENIELLLSTKPPTRQPNDLESDSSIEVASGQYMGAQSPSHDHSTAPAESEERLPQKFSQTPTPHVPLLTKITNDSNLPIQMDTLPVDAFNFKHSAIEKKEKKKVKKSKGVAAIFSEGDLGDTPMLDRMEDIDSMNMSRSGRRAAQAANERIASRQELVIQDEYSKPKKKRGDVKGLADRERKLTENEGDESNESEDDHHWVQCDSCSKWRVLPALVDVDALPKNWYCKLNIYDSIRNNCEAVEQTAMEVAKTKRKAKRKLARLARLESSISIQPIPEVCSVADVPPKEERHKKKVGRPPKDRKEGVIKKEGKKREKDERNKGASPVTLASDASGDQSPIEDSGSDSQRKLEPERKVVEVVKGPRDDADDETKECESLGVKHKGKRPRGRPAKEQFSSKEDRGSADKSSDPDNQEWVQCEKCEKWRRLPPQISAADLPDVWYCNMNTWDSHAATCEAQEDQADPGHAPVTGFSGGNKLSYRNLIFGTGKKHNRPISERMRAAESLFSSHPFDHSHEHHPVVLYANSSVFMGRGQLSKSQDEKDSERPSFFDVMNQTSLWAELRGFAQQQGAKNAYSPYGIHDPNKITIDSLPMELREEMKELIIHALGSGELESHELLLEIQSSPWENVPPIWSELRALCTSQSITGTLLDLMKEGRVESVQRTDHQAMPKFRQVVKQEPLFFGKMCEPQTEISKYMKISKPWKLSKGE